jgi:hypothetical protein
MRAEDFMNEKLHFETIDCQEWALLVKLLN